jgi:hypothetical protein
MSDDIGLVMSVGLLSLTEPPVKDGISAVPTGVILLVALVVENVCAR